MNKYTRKVAIDLLCLAAIAIPVLYLLVFAYPVKRGFNCDDDSIRYPYKDSTISSVTLYIYSTFSSAFVIISVEFVRIRRRNFTFGNGKDVAVTSFAWLLYCKLVVFVFGSLVSELLTDLAKISLGRLRPHFYGVCQPSVSCNNVTEFQIHSYVVDYDCLGPDLFRVRDARLSFMSGHSSYSMYCAVYVAIYLQKRLTCHPSNLVRPLVQMILIYVSIYVGFTRISDYKHHWSDVLIGHIQGMAVAILTAVCISDLFKEQRVTNNKIQSWSLENINVPPQQS